MLERRGNVLFLEANSTYEGERTLEWTVTDGSLERDEDDRVRWTVPDAAGLYQVEVVMDYGPDGLGFDALAVEVEPEAEEA